MGNVTSNCQFKRKISRKLEFFWHRRNQQIYAVNKTDGSRVLHGSRSRSRSSSLFTNGADVELRCSLTRAAELASVDDQHHRACHADVIELHALHASSSSSSSPSSPSQSTRFDPNNISPHFAYLIDWLNCDAGLNVITDCDSSDSWCVDTVLLFVMYILMSIVIQPSWLPNPIKFIIYQ